MQLQFQAFKKKGVHYIQVIETKPVSKEVFDCFRKMSKKQFVKAIKDYIGEN